MASVSKGGREISVPHTIGTRLYGVANANSSSKLEPKHKTDCRVDSNKQLDTCTYTHTSIYIYIYEYIEREEEEGEEAEKEKDNEWS